jgi:uncharacterized protein
MNILPDRLPWYIAGPALGLLVVGLFLVANQPLGASGAYVQTIKAFKGDTDTVRWRVWYFAGIFVGGLVAALLGAGVSVRTGYEAMTSIWSTPVVGVVVFVGAIVMGYGARMAGGCTSGHGICGTAQRSPASWVTTATFMATAIATTFVLRMIAARLHEYDTIHKTLRFDEFDVFWLMAASIGTSLPLLWLLERRSITTRFGGKLALSRTKPQRHHLIGGGLFGIGWAVAGTCPAPALVMLSSGVTFGLIAIAGLFIGIQLRDRHVAAVTVGDGEHRDLALISSPTAFAAD